MLFNYKIRRHFNLLSIENQCIVFKSEQIGWIYIVIRHCHPFVSLFLQKVAVYLPNIIGSSPNLCKSKSPSFDISPTIKAKFHCNVLSTFGCQYLLTHQGKSLLFSGTLEISKQDRKTFVMVLGSIKFWFSTFYVVFFPCLHCLVCLIPVYLIL